MFSCLRIFERLERRAEVAATLCHAKKRAGCIPSGGDTRITTNGGTTRVIACRKQCRSCFMSRNPDWAFARVVNSSAPLVAAVFGPALVRYAVDRCLSLPGSAFAPTSSKVSTPAIRGI